MILIDTSSWVESLRTNGRADVRGRVQAAIIAGRACWCEPVRLELWNGSAGEQEQRKLRDFDAMIPRLPIDDAVWDDSVKLARKARAKGITVPVPDLLIAACAFHHGAQIETIDSHFELLRNLR